MHAESLLVRLRSGSWVLAGGGCSLFEEPWWAAYLGKRDAGWWLRVIDPKKLQGLPGRVRIGFLNAAADLQQHLGHALKPYLPEVSAIVACLLETAARPEDFTSAEPQTPLRTPRQAGNHMDQSHGSVGAKHRPGESALAFHMDSQARTSSGSGPPEGRRPGKGGSRGRKRSRGTQETKDPGPEKVEGLVPLEGASTEGDVGDEPSREEAEEDHTGAPGGTEGAREVRGAAGRLLAGLWGRFPRDCDYNPLWPHFFGAAGMLGPRLAIEVCILFSNLVF